jgi:GPH family glycoside/pentoside/hexuronide:cation symporter
MYVAQNMALMPLYIMLTGIGSFIGAFLVNIIIKKLSARPLMITCYILIIGFLLLAYFNFANPWAVIVFMILTNIAYGCTNACSVALYGDCAVYAHWKFGADSRGWIMGLSNLPLKTAVIGRSAVVNIVLSIIGFNAAAIRANPDLITVGLQKGITSAFALIPALFLVFGLVCLVFGFRLTKDKVLQYQEEIRARTA